MTPDPDTAALIREMQYLRRVAALKAIPWSRAKPTKKGVWLGAKWQKTGFYHIMRYTKEYVSRLQSLPDEFWSGPYDTVEEWQLFVSQPTTIPEP